MKNLLTVTSDWHRVSKILVNGLGEELTIFFKIKKLHFSDVLNPTGYNTYALFFSSANNKNISFKLESSACYSNGDDVSHFSFLNNILFVSNGDKKRLQTYPIFIYLDGNKSKKARFQLRSLN